MAEILGGEKVQEQCYHTINSRFEPQGLINFMVHNHTGSNRDYKSIRSINLDR